MKSSKKKVTRKPAKKRVLASFTSILEKVNSLFTAPPTDLVSALKRDHDGLRTFIKVMKDTTRPIKERRSAAAQFSSLLKSHTVAEEQFVYLPMEKRANHELTIRIEEGYVEHTAADRVMADLEKATDPDVWSAHANVLAELVEHHLKEEENEMFPLIKKQIPKKLEPDLMMEFLNKRASTQTHVTEKNAGVLETLT